MPFVLWEWIISLETGVLTNNRLSTVMTGGVLMGQWRNQLRASRISCSASFSSSKQAVNALSRPLTSHAVLAGTAVKVGATDRLVG
jgi:hypothetical protein